VGRRSERRRRSRRVGLWLNMVSLIHFWGRKGMRRRRRSRRVGLIKQAVIGLFTSILLARLCCDAMVGPDSGWIQHINKIIDWLDPSSPT